jgi:hypothetical protein
VSISPFAAGTVTAEYINAYRRQLREYAESLRREEFLKLKDFYEGGNCTADTKYVRQHQREEDHAYLGRVRRMMTVNICKPVVRVISSAMYGCRVDRHIVKRGVGGRGVPAQDKRLQTLLGNRLYDIAMQNAARGASVYGTHIVGPWFNPRSGRIEFRTRHVSHAYPIPNAMDGQECDMMFFEIELTDVLTGRDYQQVEIWTDEEVGVFRNNGPGGTLFYPDPDASKWMDGRNPGANPYGVIPWVILRAESDTDEGNFFGVSDLTDVANANAFINEWLSVLDKNVLDQGWSQMVLQNFTGDAASEKTVGSAWAITCGENGDAKFIIPDLKVDEVGKLIDRVQRFALEGANVPLAAIRTYGEPRSGVSLELEIKPLLDMCKTRRESWRLCEDKLMKLTLLMDAVHSSGVPSSPEQTQMFMRDHETTAEWRDDLRPTDIEKEIQRDKVLFDMRAIDPLTLVEKYNEMKGKTVEQRAGEIKAAYDKLHPESNEQTPEGSVPDGKPAGGSS